MPLIPIRDNQFQTARAVMNVIPHVAAEVVDVTDAKRFPNIAEARRWLNSLPAERRAQLEREWRS